MDIPPAHGRPAHTPIADFMALPRRVLTAGGVVGVLVLLAIALDALGGGLSAAVVLRWMTAGLALLLSIATVLAVVHALAGADAAQRRGERLAGEDVGWVPPRRPSGGLFAGGQADRSGIPSKDEDASA